MIGAPRAADVVAAPLDLFPRAAAGYLVAINNQVRWARAADVRRPSASLAKLMAALVLLDSAWRADAIVTVSERAVRSGGARLPLRAGERVRAGALFEAMLVASSNDACLALAEHAAGSAAAFAARMNRLAGTLGLRDSHFAHPCGLDRPGQFSTPADLLRLSQVVLGKPEIAAAVARRGGELTTMQGRRIAYRSSNLLLGRLDGAAGVKTGRTADAGDCLIASVRRGKTSVVVVLLNAPDRWWTADILVEEAFRVAARE